ncbi:hypothetical protein ACFX2I_026574 [Malus domestica]
MKFGANSRENSGEILPFTAKASLSKKAFDIRSIITSQTSTNSRPWCSGSLASQRWPCSIGRSDPVPPTIPPKKEVQALGYSVGFFNELQSHSAILPLQPLFTRQKLDLQSLKFQSINLSAPSYQIPKDAFLKPKSKFKRTPNLSNKKLWVHASDDRDRSIGSQNVAEPFQFEACFQTMEMNASKMWCWLVLSGSGRDSYDPTLMQGDERATSWVLIYRTNSYKCLCSFINKVAKKLETMKTDSSSAAKITKKSKNKKINCVESSLKESSHDLLLFKFKSSALIALVLFVVFRLLNSLFEGKAVAKLPFKPI